MVKAKTAVVMAILVLLELSCTTAGQTRITGMQAAQDGHSRVGGIQAVQDGYSRVGGIQAVQDGYSRVGGITAVMKVNGFQNTADGRGGAACDGRFHSADDLIVALSPEWYGGGKRCHRTIRITSLDTGRTVEARVVDMFVCLHNCRSNILRSSPAVWKKLGLHTDIGEVRVTWSDA